MVGNRRITETNRLDTSIDGHLAVIPHQHPRCEGDRRRLHLGVADGALGGDERAVLRPALPERPARAVPSSMNDL